MYLQHTYSSNYTYMNITKLQNNSKHCKSNLYPSRVHGSACTLIMHTHLTAAH